MAKKRADEISALEQAEAAASEEASVRKLRAVAAAKAAATKEAEEELEVILVRAATEQAEKAAAVAAAVEAAAKGAISKLEAALLATVVQSDQKAQEASSWRQLVTAENTQTATANSEKPVKSIKIKADRLEQLSSLFNQLDEDRSGHISAERLQHLELIAELWECGVSSGTMSKADFVKHFEVVLPVEQQQFDHTLQLFAKVAAATRVKTEDTKSDAKPRKMRGNRQVKSGPGLAAQLRTESAVVEKRADVPSSAATEQAAEARACSVAEARAAAIRRRRPSRQERLAALRELTDE